MRYLAIGFGLLCISPAFTKPRGWKPATVADITSNTEDRGAVVMPLYGGLAGARLYVATIWYRIETADTIYVLAQSWNAMSAKRKQHPVNLTLHGQTKIATEGMNAHILDDDGKDVKLQTLEKLEYQEAKP